MLSRIVKCDDGVCVLETQDYRTRDSFEEFSLWFQEGLNVELKSLGNDLEELIFWYSGMSVTIGFTNDHGCYAKCDSIWYPLMKEIADIRLSDFDLDELEMEDVSNRFNWVWLADPNDDLEAFAPIDISMKILADRTCQMNASAFSYMVENTDPAGVQKRLIPSKLVISVEPELPLVDLLYFRQVAQSKGIPRIEIARWDSPSGNSGSSPLHQTGRRTSF